MKKTLVAVMSAVVIVLSGCGSGLDGTYAMDLGTMGKLRYTFNSNGTVLIDMYGMKTESKYELDGKNIKIATPAGNTILTLVDKNTIEGGMGMKLLKEK